uniref:Glutathione S-transferase n=1 Tax=Timema cristinae TaxID=61476 RepID=A0A7R9D2A7_TIMCR|nr:unnamed protein product [Timema cristinae]
MPLDLYYSPLSPPCITVMLTARALGVKLNLKQFNLKAWEHLSPQFCKMNPQHTIPTLDDDGFTLWERSVPQSGGGSSSPRGSDDDNLPLTVFGSNPGEVEYCEVLALKFGPKHQAPLEPITITDSTRASGHMVVVLFNFSRAILGYLVNKFGESDDPLYPRDPKKRALVDQRLYFDIGTLYQNFMEYYVNLNRYYSSYQVFCLSKSSVASPELSPINIFLLLLLPSVLPSMTSLNKTTPASWATFSKTLLSHDGKIFVRSRSSVPRFPVAFNGAEFEPKRIYKITKAIQALETFLEDQQWVAGTNLTIADISIAVTLSSAEALGFDVSPSKYPKVYQWLRETKNSISGYSELTNQAMENFKRLINAAPGNHNK